MNDDNKPKGVRPAGLPKKAVGPPGARPSGPKGAKPAGPPGKPSRPPARLGTRPAPPQQARIVPQPSGDGEAEGLPVLTKKDFDSGADVRWCPGCGDYAVLAAVRRVLPELTEKKEDVVFISGIGCASRFPYYMNTYGVHSIHGRAPTLATGLKASRPELDVWVVTGDGDALSIGAGHFAHVLRRNVDLQIILFNNEIYGLTKGQYSPTSEMGKVTKSTPYGSLDHPFNPLGLGFGAEGTFLARTLDRDPKHMQAIFRRAHAHRGTSLVEVYQNCNIFNDGAFFTYTERESRALNTVLLEHGRPVVYDEGRKGLKLDGLQLKSIDLTNSSSTSDCLVHDETDRTLAQIYMQQLFRNAELPRPFGVIYVENRPTYDALMQAQIDEVTAKKGKGDLKALLHAGHTWTID